jgi:hypothetical protein
MVNRLLGMKISLRAGLLVAVAVLPLCVFSAQQAQDSVPLAPDPSLAAQSPEHQTRKAKERPLPGRMPDKPSLPPTYSIPVGALGFSAPGPHYLGARNSLASLDFLDENRLLFTFRVPGLMRREAGDSAGSDERKIRAEVLTLPLGTVEAEALWTVHDRVRYLWMLKDGHFLLRDRDGLAQSDATLVLKPLLQFPGPLLWLELDPTGQYLVTNSREPVAAVSKAGEADSASNHPSDQDQSLGTPSTASANLLVDGQKPDGATDLVVRILRRESGKVMLVSRTRTTVHLPINADGYLEGLRGNGQLWMLNLNYFSGGSKILGRVDSACSPAFDFVSQQEVLVTACAAGGGRKLVAMATDGRRLWEDSTSPLAVWPLLVRSPDGSRLAQETLAVDHPVNAYSPIDWQDVKGQLVRVFDAADGKVALEAPANPALDAGGNVAISPSGRRVAVLNAGAIQIFDLPAPPALAGDRIETQTTH